MFMMYQTYSRFTQAYTSLSGHQMPYHLLQPTARTEIQGAASGDELYPSGQATLT